MFGQNKDVIESYFRDKTLVAHHVKSYNRFIDTGLQSVIDEVGKIQPELDDFYIKLGKIKVKEPIVKEADGSTRRVYPHECRLRDRTYSAPLVLEMTPVEREEEREPLNVVIGRLPVMLKSKICYLSGLGNEELMRVGEDPKDPGGYFIVNGTERVLVLVEDLASNRVLVEHHKITDVDMAKLFSARDWYRRPCTLSAKSDTSLHLSFPPLAKPVPASIVMKALGLQTDKDIVTAISDDPEIVSELFVSLEQGAEVKNMRDALDFIGKRVAVGQQMDARIERAEHILDRYLLPHVGMESGDRVAKAFFIGRMAEKLIKYRMGIIEQEDKDHYANKRLRLAGDLLEDVFRVAFRGLVANAVYSLEKAARRERKTSIRIAIRASLLSDRISHAMATGAWVGGRQGVSQHLDRLNYLAVLSHLRRVRSLLSRTQPHFEARDLHATHWGKICPNETPEGSNIGLVKNLSMMSEISQVSDPAKIESVLAELGVEKKW